MTTTFIITLGILILSLLAPFISLYAVSFIKKKDYRTHIKIQKRLFWTCVIAVLILEIQIRVAGGSGSLVANSAYTHTSFFKTVLVAHIIGAVLTYIIWGITIFASNKKYKKRETLPGSFSIAHKRLGYVSIIGLFYTAITALIVYIFAFFL
ncbi:DUF420 domain-containing protein [Gelidibacter maritimus]|uniref:DUF420 domain-containing protein n=1 Tax=Gelidibacter maritimus TaxID=2761487 RepID=A0A7W2R592_9FLAO|nr:DUF420 domain-containing protein [Gelidibacter maritimus]MBA6154691.1 DUF420 domain-containing protein [Gelidibacter maritimus]